MGRLNSKYYRFRAEQNALNNVAPRTAEGGVFSRRYDKPSGPSSGGLVGMLHRRDEKRWQREQRHMQRGDYSRRSVDFQRRGVEHGWHGEEHQWHGAAERRHVVEHGWRGEEHQWRGAAELRHIRSHGYEQAREKRDQVRFKQFKVDNRRKAYFARQKQNRERY
ncbi:MAG: hypothetical protein H7836_13205 [Magnetococcus sp. YQC-3]